jgi:hypothetical protein
MNNKIITNIKNNLDTVVIAVLVIILLSFGMTSHISWNKRQAEALSATKEFSEPLLIDSGRIRNSNNEIGYYELYEIRVNGKVEYVVDTNYTK